MERTKSDYIRICIRTRKSCKLKLTGISAPDASYSSADNRVWIEAPIDRKHLLVSMSFSRDIVFSIFLGSRSALDKEAPCILYKRLLVNQENLLSEEIATGAAPIIVEHMAHRDEYMRMVIEWDILDIASESQSYALAPALITAETVANMHISAACESEQDRKLRLDNWNTLNASLEKEQSLLQPPEYVVIDSKRLVYIVNSKVANTSIKYSMLEEHFDDDYWIHRALINRDISVSELTEAQRDYFTFTFVRNPFSRLVSCYVSKYHTDINIYKMGQSIFEDYLDGYIRNDEGFDRFVDKICEIPHRLLDRHFCLQYDIVFDEEGRCRCDFIGKFEKLNEDFESIRESFGLRRLPHYNTTYMDKWMDFYAEESARKVYDKYRQDFEAFGYSDEYDKLIDYIKTKQSR